jgi:hypothetical protein
MGSEAGRKDGAMGDKFWFGRIAGVIASSEVFHEWKIQLAAPTLEGANLNCLWTRAERGATEFYA